MRKSLLTLWSKTGSDLDTAYQPDPGCSLLPMFNASALEECMWYHDSPSSASSFSELVYSGADFYGFEGDGDIPATGPQLLAGEASHASDFETPLDSQHFDMFTPPDLAIEPRKLELDSGFGATECLEPDLLSGVNSPPAPEAYCTQARSAEDQAWQEVGPNEEEAPPREGGEPDQRLCKRRLRLVPTESRAKRRAAKPRKGYHRSLTATDGPDSRKLEDRILLEARAQNMTYKEILDKYNFAVTESTLRGRYRAITKDSAERPRSPQWTESDVGLLLQAVPLFRRRSGRSRVYWKGVSDYISTNGGSRSFGFSTCHRKYLEVTGGLGTAVSRCE
ncbi:hypothetical protein UVI_02061560 [Ustilaginoidea virens]|uniref:Myb-like domain-containing protein n=1 Tax=Ustilaginoidea virens TaxID=1159556 RepID=A0A1B5L7P0_USTVR|nr:hypothetical protein UVI_02061560 [Ustilaginoidea virens]